MGDEFQNEVGLLRATVRNLKREVAPLHPDYISHMRANNVPLPSEEGQSKTSILPDGRKAFGDLADCLVARSPPMARGTVHDNVLGELFKQLETFLGRDPSSIVAADAQALSDHMLRWFEASAGPRRVFVPCVLTPHAAPSFRIGPVAFVFIDDISVSGWAPDFKADELDRHAFGQLVKWMKEAHGNWLARAAIEGCERDRAQEVGALAVDLAIVALQLAAPHYGTRDMCRLEVRRGFNYKHSLVEQDGHYNAGWTRTEAGISIGRGTLADVLKKTAPLITAVGNVVQSFASGVYRKPNLERAWCDAAYWLREALAEPMDSIAMAKLETALEVLLRSESSKGSTRRLLTILRYFFGLKPDDPILNGSAVTARQFAANVVGDRSRILHGTWSTLHARLSMDRRGMEGFTITVIRRAVLELEAYCTVPDTLDTTNAFLDWLGRREPPPAA
jgi:hypothetical protein